MKTIITVGIPASGKTTWSKEFVKTNRDYVRVSRDDFRLMLKDSDVPNEGVENLINGLMVKTIIKCLTKYNVIVDATHVKLSYINDIVKEISEFCDIEFKVFDTEYSICLERNGKRERKVPLDVMERMQTNFLILKQIFKFETIYQNCTKIKERNVELRDIVIFDIDGTISIKGDRSPFEWHKVGIDTVCIPVCRVLKYFYDSGWAVFLISGRDEVCRRETQNWLSENEIQYHQLFMRKENDFRKDSVVKKEIYESEIKDKYNVFAVFDDRLQVLDMWYKQGVFSFNVNQGNKEF